MAEPVQQNPQIISAEVRRRLSPVSYSSNTLSVLDLPRDTVLKRLNIRASGSFSVTYASGSPVADAAGFMSRLCPRLDVVIDGNRTVKSLDLYMQRLMNLVYGGQPAERAFTTSASAPTTSIAGTEAPNGAPFTYPATTQFVLLNESVEVFFEMPWAYSMGKEATMLNLKGVSSAELRFNFADIANLQRFESSPVAVTYGATNVSFVATTVEASEVASDTEFLDFKETVRRLQYSAESRQSLADLPRGNALAGIALLSRNGDANKSLSDLPIRDLQLLINGQRLIQTTTFIELQQSLRVRHGVAAPKASSVSNLQGFAYMNLLKNGDIRSAINTTINAGVDQIQLAVTTGASSGTDAVTYTNPVELTIMTQEIAAVPKRQ